MDSVGLKEALRLDEPQGEGVTLPVKDSLPQSLEEGLPLAERTPLPVVLKDGVADVQAEPVSCKLPLGSPLGVHIEDAVPLTTLLLLGDAQEEAEAAVVDEALLQPLKEGLVLAERTPLPVVLKDGVADVQAEPVSCKLPLGSPLGVHIEDAVPLTTLLLLGDAQEEAEAAVVDEALLQPLKEGLVLAEKTTLPVVLKDGVADVQAVPVSCKLLLWSPLDVATEDGVPLTVPLLVGDAQEEAEAAVVDEALLQPLKEGLPLTERVTASVTLKEGVVDVQAVPVSRKLPLASPLGVVMEDAVPLPVLLLLGDAQEEADAGDVDEALLQPLKEGLPLTERVTERTALTDGDAVVQVVPVSGELPLGSPLGVDNKEAVALTVLLPLGDAKEEDDAPPVDELLLLPLKEGLPLTERVSELTVLTDGDADEQAVPVSCKLPLG